MAGRNCGARGKPGGLGRFSLKHQERRGLRKMRLKKKLWITILATSVIAGCLLYFYARSSVLSFECGHSVLSESASPDGQYVATVFERNCGAMTPYTRIVSIRRGRSTFDGEDNRSWVFVVKDQPTIRVSWSGPRQLIVETDGYSRTPREQRLKLSHWEDVAVFDEKP
jgi:hypothetical protein